MSLATLLNVPSAADARSLSEWSFSNQDQHRQIVDALAAQKNIVVQLYPLDPIPSYGLVGWFQNHQQAHNDMANALNIALFDLSDVDFKDSEQLAAWVRLHFDMHQQAAQILGFS